MLASEMNAFTFTNDLFDNKENFNITSGSGSDSRSRSRETIKFIGGKSLNASDYVTTNKQDNIIEDVFEDTNIGSIKEVNKQHATTKGKRIDILFANAFSHSRDEFDKLLDGSILTSRVAQSNMRFTSKVLGISDDSHGQQKSLIGYLKAALQTYLNEVENLRQECIHIENQYYIIFSKTDSELGDVYNIMFKLQQKSSALERANVIRIKLTENYM